MASKKSNTGMRNGNLFCFNCGTSQVLPLPMPADLAGEWMIGFDKVHRGCPKTWEEPVNAAEEKTENENLKWWIENGEHGLSSKTIARHLGSYPISMNGFSESTPCDPSDFYRCHKLLVAVPQFKERLHEMKAVSPVWGALVDNWDKLTEMLEEQISTKKPNGMYEFMKKLGC